MRLLISRVLNAQHRMFDDFFVRALIAGTGVALVAAPCGCFVVWRRMAYFGDTLAHSALLGIALSIAFATDVTLTMFTLAIGVALLLLLLEQRTDIPTDALLGILAHSGLALSLLWLSVLDPVRADLMAVLFGDILIVSITDMAVIYGGGIVVLALLTTFWRRLLVVTINAELAAAEGINPRTTNIVLVLILSAAVVMAVKIVGALLITALLITPAATARSFATSPLQMVVLAALIGVASVVCGLFMSLHFDTLPGPSIVVVALIFFIGGVLYRNTSCSSAR